jgi:hypothetical protein
VRVCVCVCVCVCDKTSSKKSSVCVCVCVCVCGILLIVLCNTANSYRHHSGFVWQVCHHHSVRVFFLLFLFFSESKLQLRVLAAVDPLGAAP